MIRNQEYRHRLHKGTTYDMGREKRTHSAAYIYLFIHLLGGFYQQHNPHSYTLNLVQSLCVDVVCCQFKSTKYEAKQYLPIKRTITHNIHIKYHEWFCGINATHTHSRKNPCTRTQSHVSRIIRSAIHQPSKNNPHEKKNHPWKYFKHRLFIEPLRVYAWVYSHCMD